MVTPFMAEVLSSNVSPLAFVGVAWGLIWVYCFPVLLLREWAVRRGVSLGGLLFAGFGYGLFNEGLIAKTLFLNRKVPWDLFDGHIGFGGINWGWLLVICAYHALFSVVTPLLLIEKLRPQTAGQTWLSKRSASALLALVALVSLGYFGQKPATSPVGFWLLWIAIATFVAVGSLWRGAWTPRFNFNARPSVWMGALFLPLMLLCGVAFAHGTPFFVFVLAMALLWFVIGGRVTHGGESGALLVGLGASAGMSALNIIVSGPTAKVVGFLALAVIVWWLRTHRSDFTTNQPMFEHTVSN